MDDVQPPDPIVDLVVQHAPQRTQAGQGQLLGAQDLEEGDDLWRLGVGDVGAVLVQDPDRAHFFPRFAFAATPLTLPATVLTSGGSGTGTLALIQTRPTAVSVL